MAVGLARTRTTTAILLVLEVLSAFLLVTRFWVLRKRRRTTSALFQDGLFFFSSTTSLLMTGWSLKKIYEEFGYRQKTDSEMLVLIQTFDEPWLKIEFAFMILYLAEIWAMKAAFLLFYGSLFRRAQITGARLSALYVTAIVIGATWIALMAVIFTHCRPLSIHWDRIEILRSGKACNASMALIPQIVLTVLNVVTDLLLLALPLIVISMLNLSRTEKFAIPFVFFIGSVSIAANLIRFFVLKSLGTYGEHNPLTNALKQVHWINILAHLETLTAQMAFTMPSLRRMLARCFRERSGRGRESTGESIRKMRAAFRLRRVGESAEGGGVVVEGREELVLRTWGNGGPGEEEERGHRPSDPTR